MKKRLSPLTTDKLLYYVYALIDPRDGQVFYVGKGKGSRIYSHIDDAESIEPSEVAKIAKIREIKSALKDGVDHVVVRHGLSSEEALEVEASLIDYIESVQKITLTNIVSGHHSAELGLRRISALELQYGAPPMVPKHDLILIRINKAYKREVGEDEMDKDELYRVTRKHWKLNLARANKVKHVCAVYLGVVREVYEVAEWYASKEVIGRNEFTGVIAPDEIRELYRHTSVNHLMQQGSQNPILYVTASNK